MICNHICEDCDLNDDDCLMDDVDEEDAKPVDD